MAHDTVRTIEKILAPVDPPGCAPVVGQDVKRVADELTAPPEPGDTTH
jgi:hypothetical protein